MNTIDLKLLRNAEYLQYMKDFTSIIGLNNPTQLAIDVKLNAFILRTEELESLYKKAMASEKTQEILKIDERRDDAVNGIYYFLLAHTYHFDPAKQKNAKVLVNNMDIVNLKYTIDCSTSKRVILKSFQS